MLLDTATVMNHLWSQCCFLKCKKVSPNRVAIPISTLSPAAMLPDMYCARAEWTSPCLLSPSLFLSTAHSKHGWLLTDLQQTTDTKNTAGVQGQWRTPGSPVGACLGSARGRVSPGGKPRTVSTHSVHCRRRTRHKCTRAVIHNRFTLKLATINPVYYDNGT